MVAILFATYPGACSEYDMGKSKNTGEQWFATVFRVGPDTKNRGFNDDDLADGWYWFCQADHDEGVYGDDPSPKAGIHGPFPTEEAAVENADSMGMK